MQFLQHIISTSTQNASVWLLTAAAPSNSVFLCAVYRFAYLLTYKTWHLAACNASDVDTSVSHVAFGLTVEQQRIWVDCGTAALFLTICCNLVLSESVM